MAILTYDVFRSPLVFSGLISNTFCGLPSWGGDSRDRNMDREGGRKLSEIFLNNSVKYFNVVKCTSRLSRVTSAWAGHYSSVSTSATVREKYSIILTTYNTNYNTEYLPPPQPWSQQTRHWLVSWFTRNHS